MQVFPRQRPPLLRQRPPLIPRAPRCPTARPGTLTWSVWPGAASVSPPTTCRPHPTHAFRVSLFFLLESFIKDQTAVEMLFCTFMYVRLGRYYILCQTSASVFLFRTSVVFLFMYFPVWESLYLSEQLTNNLKELCWEFESKIK